MDDYRNLFVSLLNNIEIFAPFDFTRHGKSSVSEKDAKIGLKQTLTHNEKDTCCYSVAVHPPYPCRREGYEHTEEGRDNHADTRSRSEAD